MRPLRLSLFSFLLLAAAVITFACGTNSSPTHQLQSLAVTPASADAQNFPDGQVPFTATGTYSSAPSPVTPLTATWGACTQAGVPTTDVLVSSSGTAQCASGASGTYSVWANDPNATGPVCNVVNACGGGCGLITGAAKLTCP